MKLKYEFSVREIAGDYILIPLGEGALALSGMITTNEVGAYICEKLKSNIDTDQLVEMFLEDYEVDEKTAKKDIAEFLEHAKLLGIVEEA